MGRLWSAETPCHEPETILSECAAIVSSAVKDDFAVLERSSAHTSGQKFYLERGLTGVRGEAARGFHLVSRIALPALNRALEAGLSRNDAGAVTLLHLIAQGTDTNMVSRGGLELAQAAARQCRTILEQNSLLGMEEIAAIDRDFIRQNLSPGGCADLLAAAYFLQSWGTDI